MGESKHMRETSVRTAGRWCLHCESALVESALKCPACGTITERGKLEAFPLMLEALREVTEALGHWQNAPPVAQDWFTRARAAIKAATGGET